MEQNTWGCDVVVAAAAEAERRNGVECGRAWSRGADEGGYVCWGRRGQGTSLASLVLTRWRACVGVISRVGKESVGSLEALGKTRN